jgi:transposase
MPVKKSVDNPHMTAREIRVSVGGSVAQVSINTVKRSLIRQGRFAYRPRKSPSLSTAQRNVRLRWCQQHRDWSAEQWKKVRAFRVFYHLIFKWNIAVFSF